MNALTIPFNSFIGLQEADSESEYILALEERKELVNHLGTLHAGALFTLAEATSGAYLIQQLSNYELDNVIPVVRKIEVKYSKPGNGKVYSKANFVNTDASEIIAELKSKKRIIIKVKVDVFNDSDDKLLTSIIDWFFTLH